MINPLAIGSIANAAGALPAAAGAGAAAAGAGGASMGFMQALLGTPKGFAALGQGIGTLGKVAGMMIGGKKGAKIAQSAGMFNLVASLAPDIGGMFKSAPSTESGGGTFNYNPLPGGTVPSEQAKHSNLDYLGILGNTFA